ncbi:rod-binding protein [Sphingobium subterraneum]|uniref:Rod binding domain-containing protein n=1 Tax=Sphingobium subterraneum TaxID=627688 RepID=A0A841IZC8_9SPHN|nr:rod-binding protein [Sphingobium subterraneum]MBB6124319.1 Rod binding domain-containing protein [Sphingobium subterraneum]
MVEPVGHAPALPPTDAKARTAAREFEAVFLGEMTRLMMESVQSDNQFGGGHGEDMFRGVLADTMGRSMAESRTASGTGIGIADQVLAEIIRLQKGSQP